MVPSLRSLIAAAFALAAIILAGPAAAADYVVGNLLITQPWAPPTLTPNQAGAAYLAVTNNGERPDTLMGATTAAASQTMLHRTVLDSDIARMVQLGQIDIPAGGAAALAPGGMHFMLLGLEAPLVEGQSFVLTLHFQRAGSVDVEVEVMGLGATAGTAPGAGL